MRCCFDCGAPIRGCMGFCKASDVLDFMSGLRTTIRELCGECQIKIPWKLRKN